MTVDRLEAEIRELMDDPCGGIFIYTWHLTEGDVRWNTGMIGTRRKGRDTFTLPVGADEFLDDLRQLRGAGQEGA